MLSIRIKYHDREMPRIQLVDGKSDWYDLRSAETLTLKAGESRAISLGISMELPVGYEAHIVPRSSTFSRWGLIQVNSPGIIDNVYSGDNDIWHMIVIATRDVTVNKYDRICQFRLFKKQEELSFTEVEVLGNVDRGGLGSTGVA